MIGTLLGLVPARFAPLTPKLLAAIVAQSLSQAAAYLLLVPTLEAVFDDDLDRAWVWALCMLAAVVAFAIFGYLQASIGLRIAVGMQRGLQTRIGDHLNALPLGWFETRGSGRLSRIAVENVREIQGAVAYLEKPFEHVKVVAERIESVLARRRERHRHHQYLLTIKERNREFLEQYKAVRADLEAWLGEE